MLMFLFLAGDLALVFLLAMQTNKQLHLPRWKIAVYSLAVVPVGFLCSKIMRLIEAGTWVGASYYGAVLFEPIILVLFGLLIHIKPAEMFDLGAPSACISLVFLKIQCIVTGCCIGRILGYESHGRPIRFPSPYVEIICGLILLGILMKMISSGKYKGYMYFWFLLLYGVSRFFLNLLRDTQPFLLGMSAGCFWSVISVCIGGAVLLLRHKRMSESFSG